MLQRNTYLKFRATVLGVLALVALTARADSKWVSSSKDETWMTYHMVHPLHKFDGTSHSVQFKLQVDPATHQLQSVTAETDVTTYDSGNSSRDSHAMEVIDALTFPTASFESAVIATNGDSIVVRGRMTFHGVTKNVTISAKAQWAQNKLTVTGHYVISLTEFNIERPSLLMIPVEDGLAFDFQAVFWV